MKLASDQLRTWVEIDAKAARKNLQTFRKLTGPRVAVWSVVKSNAYGHGLFTFAKLMDEAGIDGFCVDSIVEALALRREGIKRPILVLGQTLPSRLREAAGQHITVSVSNFEALAALARTSGPMPDFHIKIDTGMHRQGFYFQDLPKVIKTLKGKKKGGLKNDETLGGHLKGLFTHFASAKDINFPTFTDEQLESFSHAIATFEHAGYRDLMKHAAATGGALLHKKYHFDAVRIGIGLCGIWPSKELEIQLGGQVKLASVLNWRAIISEVKVVPKGGYIGYNMTERVPQDTKVAIVPIGYWHGFPWALSGRGEIIVRGRRARVLGRVSMDMIVIGPVSKITRPGDIVTLIGRAGRVEISAEEQAARTGGATMNYELLTRLNPLMERVIIR